jgi:hypothetical protein
VTTDIPSAAKVQDIGPVRHVAHHGHEATAQFTDWALDTDPDLPDEPDPEPGWDTPPAASRRCPTSSTDR